MKCARTVCNNQDADCKHTQSGRMYCRSCARSINRYNPEVPGLVSIPNIQPANEKTRNFMAQSYAAGFQPKINGQGR